MQLRPNVEELEKLYANGSVSSLFNVEKGLMDSKLTTSSLSLSSSFEREKVGAPPPPIKK